ncbi:MAG: endonuclease, partial [Muribaculaceae bacterium]|nr:endonuclease [Muribaculaceae bacterium]
MKSFGSILLCAAVLSATAARGAEPANYYSTCEGRKGQSLLTALEGVVGNHTNVGYNGLWTLYQTTDTRPNGTIWDMYSTKEYKYKTDQCGSYSVVGSCYNREHSMPKSWFNDASPMSSDAFHIYPTDGKVNGQRSNYPYGECAGGTTLPASGGIKALGRLGSSTFAGYSGTVFEPDDEYKGDFARTYFYMAAAYNSRISSWDSDMLAGNKYPVFTNWAMNLLLKWHRQDPVSEKETKRNDAVYAAQHNRNPFIDHPELAEHIWGNLQNEDWHPAGENTPSLTLPVDNSALDLGVTVAGYPRTATLRIKGVALTGNVTLSVSGNAFSVSPATVSKANAIAGTDVTVTYNPAAEGNHTGVLTVSCGQVTARVNLSGRAISTLPAGPVTSVSDDSFEARWSNVGDADARGEYTLDVQLDGESIDEFPRSVKASDEYFIVEGLEPNTTYTYYVKSQHLTSATVSVTTLEPRPLVEFLFDGGDLDFYTEPGVPSNVAELLVNVENITEDITVSVSAPFELSTDKSTWSTSIIIKPEEDRIYLRLNSAAAGSFMTSITATAGSYHNDDAEARGEVSESEYMTEDFEVVDSKVASYNPPAYQGTGCVWNFKDTGIWAQKSEAHTGNQAARMG